MTAHEARVTAGSYLSNEYLYVSMFSSLRFTQSPVQLATEATSDTGTKPPADQATAEVEL